MLRPLLGLFHIAASILLPADFDHCNSPIVKGLHPAGLPILLFATQTRATFLSVTCMLARQAARAMSTAGPAAAAGGPIASSIHRKLTAGLQPTELRVVNESSKHAGHSGNPTGAPDAETHFKCVLRTAAGGGVESWAMRDGMGTG